MIKTGLVPYRCSLPSTKKEGKIREFSDTYLLNVTTRRIFQIADVEAVLYEATKGKIQKEKAGSFCMASYFSRESR